MTQKEITNRFLQAIDQLCKEKGKNVKQLTDSLPFTAGYITNLRKKDQNIGSQFIVSLYRKHQINPMWILTGEGEMKIEKGKKVKKASLESIQAQLDKIREVQGETINELLKAIISIDILPADVKKKLAVLGQRGKN